MSHMLALTDHRRTWGMLAHATGTVGTLFFPSLFGFVGPLIILALHKDDPVIAHHAREAAVFQGVMSLAAWVIAFVAGASCLFFWLGILALVPWLASVIVPVVGAVKVWRGEAFAYPVTGGMLEP